MSSFDLLIDFISGTDVVVVVMMMMLGGGIEKMLSTD